MSSKFRLPDSLWLFELTVFNAPFRVKHFNQMEHEATTQGSKQEQSGCKYQEHPRLMHHSHSFCYAMRSCHNGVLQPLSRMGQVWSVPTRLDKVLRSTNSRRNRFLFILRRFKVPNLTRRSAALSLSHYASLFKDYSP